MASWQAHLLVIGMKLTVKRHMSRVTDFKQARAKLSGARRPVPSGVAARPSPVGGIGGEWLEASGVQPAGTLLYLHGGGYFACSPQTHRPITSGLALRGLAVFAPDYRLAPENPFPAAVEDAVAAYRGLLASGIDPSTLVVGGDSAGGGLALAMLVSLRDAGDPLPAGGILFSPWTDLAGTGPSMERNHRRDAMFPGRGIERAAAPYLNGADPRTPLASPLYAELHGLPPLLIHVGSYEVLLDDSTRLADRARAAGSNVTVRTWPVVPHVWPLFPIPEAAQSLDAAAAFLRERLTPPSRPSSPAAAPTARHT